MKLKFLILPFLFVNVSFACAPGTTTKIYNCKNDLEGNIAKKANMEVKEEMEKNPEACIKKTSNRIAEKYGCEVSVKEGSKKK